VYELLEFLAVARALIVHEALQVEQEHRRQNLDRRPPPSLDVALRRRTLEAVEVLFGHQLLQGVGDGRDSWVLDVEFETEEWLESCGFFLPGLRECATELSLEDCGDRSWCCVFHLGTERQLLEAFSVGYKTIETSILVSPVEVVDVKFCPHG
jgi:hypothetical protein